MCVNMPHLILYMLIRLLYLPNKYGGLMSNEQKFLDQLDSWDVARLIPTLPDSKREEKATSILLAAFRVVPIFALDMLKEAGAPAT